MTSFLLLLACAPADLPDTWWGVVEGDLPGDYVDCAGACDVCIRPVSGGPLQRAAVEVDTAILHADDYAESWVLEGEDLVLDGEEVWTLRPQGDEWEVETADGSLTLGACDVLR